MAKITISSLQTHKQNGRKFAVSTCYDASFAAAIERAGIEVILVGDSLGMVLQGHDSTLPVTVSDIAYHTACVSRGCSAPLIIADMPFGSYANREQCLDNAAELMRHGAHMVKVEGGNWLCDSIQALTERGIPVCAHLGLTPQSVNAFGGFKVQGRADDSAQQILTDARAVTHAGAKLLVLECVPTTLAAEITQAIDIPVIGIGAGVDTDAQVLVLHDMLGVSTRAPRFTHNFLGETGSVEKALEAYRLAVEEGRFPGPEHSFS